LKKGLLSFFAKGAEINEKYYSKISLIYFSFLHFKLSRPFLKASSEEIDFFSIF
jgi:hypothetical protein